MKVQEFPDAGPGRFRCYVYRCGNCGLSEHTDRPWLLKRCVKCLTRLGRVADTHYHQRALP